MSKISPIALFVLVSLSISGLYEAKMTTEEKLIKLRHEMEQAGYHAYIIPSDDEHQSEYTAEYDRRRAWISGLTGSSGTAVVTMTQALVWTDSRYYLQAEMQLDPKFWTLMKASESTTPSIETWLAEHLQDGEKVGLMAKFTAIDVWESRKKVLSESGVFLEDAKNDLIDKIWTTEEGRPPKPHDPLMIHDTKYAGKTWAEKITDVKSRMSVQGADLFVVTALDEVAWLLNLRGSDVPNNPFFFAYVIVTNDLHTLYIDQSRVDAHLREYLNPIQIKDYSAVNSDIQAASESGKKVWVSPMSSYSIYDSVKNKDDMVMRVSPIRSIKARKTDVELKNLRDCHIRDSVARNSTYVLA